MPRVVTEFRTLGDDELLERLESSKEELFNLRFQLATGQLDNPMRIKQVRHDIARVLTVLRERHLEADVEVAVLRADEEAMAESRAAQASGELQGEPLGDVIEEALEERAEEAAEAEAEAEGEAEEAAEEEK
jgi:large subunit ribosomal protein L29